MAGGVSERAAPYPADTRAKGWRFELDHERIRQSDTWALAPAEARPWLLMLWMVAWEQVPCGSLPADDALVAARIGAPEKFWAKHKALLLRGWWLADDGRRYHDTIAARVTEMLARKLSERQRKAEYRERMDAQRRAQLSHGTDTGRPRDGRVGDDTGTGTGTGTGEIQPQQEIPVGEARKRATRKCPAGFELTAEIRKWAAEHAPLVSPDAELAKLKDHTYAAARSDWDGALRNWLRRAQEDAEARMQRAGNGRPPPMTTADRNAETKRLLGIGEHHA